MAKQCSTVYICHIFFICSLINQLLGYFLILAIVNNAAMNLRVQIPFWVYALIFFRQILRSGIPGWYGSFIFSVWRTLLTVFHSGCINLVLTNSTEGEGNGNTLQCSCLENPRDGGTRWAAIYGVAQSRTWLKWLSSSSSNSTEVFPFHYIFTNTCYFQPFW